MSVAQAPIDRRPSPSSTATNPFASNNPFRNRVSASSPDLPSPSMHQSRNPFLDVFVDENADTIVDGQKRSTNNAMSNSPRAQGGPVPKLESETSDLLINLSIDDTAHKSQDRIPGRSSGGGSRLREGSTSSKSQQRGPLRPPRMAPPPPQHHHTRSSEASAIGGAPLTSSVNSMRVPGASSRGREDARNGPSRQRSNSESSILASTSEIDRNKERKRYDKSKREVDDKANDDKTKKAIDRKKRGAPLDVIDKLDVTGIYGGGFFHHDGPFDACNPHRNKNKSRAPMQAFPEGSKNNALTGFDPNLRSSDHSHVFGNRDPEAYLDFNAGSGRRGSEPFQEQIRPGSKRALSFDPINRPIVHGDESLGLGTSTFLQGAPAAKKAIEKAQTIDEEQRPITAGGIKDGGGLQRKKSLAQKIRSISQSKPNLGEPGSERIAPGFDRRHKPSMSSSPIDTSYLERPRSPASPPPINRSTKMAGVQLRDEPVEDYDGMWDRKGESIQVMEESRRKRERAPSSPKKPYLGRATSENRVPQTSAGTDQVGGGLLKRVKSLSKGKRRDGS